MIIFSAMTGQPRWRCEGMLLLSRWFTIAFLLENVVQVSTATVSVRATAAGSTDAKCQRKRVRSARFRFVAYHSESSYTCSFNSIELGVYGRCFCGWPVFWCCGWICKAFESRYFVSCEDFQSSDARCRHYSLTTAVVPVRLQPCKMFTLNLLLFFVEIEKIQKRRSHKTSSGNLATTWFASILNSVSSVTFVEGSQFLSAALVWYVGGRHVHLRIDDPRRGSPDGRTTPLHRKRD